MYFYEQKTQNRTLATQEFHSSSNITYLIAVIGVNVVLFAWGRDPTAQKFKWSAQSHSNSVVALGTV